MPTVSGIQGQSPNSNIAFNNFLKGTFSHKRKLYWSIILLLQVMTPLEALRFIVQDRFNIVMTTRAETQTRDSLERDPKIPAGWLSPFYFSFKWFNFKLFDSVEFIRAMMPILDVFYNSFQAFLDHLKTGHNHSQKSSLFILVASLK